MRPDPIKLDNPRARRLIGSGLGHHDFSSDAAPSAGVVAPDMQRYSNISISGQSRSHLGNVINYYHAAPNQSAELTNDYRQALDFLPGLEQTLKNLALAGKALPKTAATKEMLMQVQGIIDVSRPLYADLRKSKLKWTSEQSKKVEQLGDAVAVPLATINANIGMEIL